MPGVWNPLTGGTMSGGGGLGTASGRIIIDISDVNRSAVDVRRASGEMERAFEGVGSAAQRGISTASGAIRQFGKDVQSLRGELAAIGLAGAAFVKLGLDSANSMRGTRVQLTAMLGSQEKATALMARMRDLADKYGLDMKEVNATAAALLPVLKGNTTELDKWVSRAARLSTKGPLAGTEAAAKNATRAIGEFVAGQERSLQMLFNIAPNLIHEAVSQAGGDRGKALDIILAKIGATEQAAEEMGKGWTGAMNRMSNATTQALDQAFTPLIDEFFVPGLNTLTEWLKTIQETNPQVLELGAGFATAAAVGAPFLLFLGQVITSLEKIQAMKISPALGKVGATGLAVAGGVGIGIEASRAIGRRTGNEELANADANSLVDIFKKVFVSFIQGLATLNFQLEFATLKLKNAFGELIISLAKVVEGIAKFVGQFDPTKGKLFAGGAAVLKAEGSRMQTSDRELELFAKQGLANIAEATKKAFEFAYPQAAPGEGFGGGPGIGGGTGGVNADVLDSFKQFNEDLKEISRQADQDRLEEEQKYEERRTKIIEDYGRQREKVVQDAEKRIARLEEDTARQIEEVRQNASERESQENADYAENVAKINQDYQREEERRLEDFQREEKRARQQHALNLLSAAARLDAKGIWEENNRYNLERDQKKEQFDAESQERAEQLQERLQQEAEGHQERLEEARKADEKRIEDLRDRLARETQMIREDTRERLQEMAEAHQRELQELDRTHQQRLAQIDQQEAEARNRRQQAFIEEIAALDQHYAILLGTQAQGQAAIEAAFQDWFNRMIGDAKAASGASGDSSSGGTTGSKGGGIPYAAGGGPINTTGPAMLHGSPSRPEYVLSPETTAALNSMLNGQLTQGALLSAVAQGHGGKSITVGSIGITLGDIGQHSLPDIKRMVREGIIDAFDEIGGPG